MVISNSEAIMGFGAIFFVSLISFSGALTLASKSKTLPNLYQMLIPFATGALIGTTFYHILPEAVERTGFTNSLATLIIIGISIPFILEKAVNWHHHHALEHDELYDQHEKTQSPSSDRSIIKPFVYVNLLGDGLHNFVDGAIIITTFAVSTELGLATLVGIIIHEIAQEMGDFSVMVEGGMKVRNALLWNFISALTALLGGIIALLVDSDLLVEIILPIAAGNFLYLAIADLIPELNKKVARKDWILQVGVGSVAIFLMYTLTFIG
ncbi:MAG: ZIP family metal transporter [Candidatus Heimdallarchaeota archaeon]|nr:ZIP family metal transporter [Candidatus Heimdallarchaeota archaeon]